jgi:hypothetical protein
MSEEIKISDTELYTCERSGVSELYWHGGRICIDLGNDIDKEKAKEIFNCLKEHDRLTEENNRLREVAGNAAFVCNTFSRDLNGGFRTKDKEFAVSLLCGAVDLLSELDGDKSSL